MSQGDTVKIKGEAHIVLKDKNGKVKKEVKKANLVVTAGKNLIAAWLAGEAPTNPTHFAIGTDATAAAAGDTALIGTELARVTFTSSTRSTNTIPYVGTFAAGVGTGTIEEAGIFNAASAGTMLCRFLTGTFDKGASDSLEITWTLTVG